MKDYGSGNAAPPQFDLKQSPPNVLLITTDHWPGLLTRPMGNPTVMTPTLEMLARNGTLFSNAYSACPVCGPARRTLLTGLSPRSHGMLGNGDLPWDSTVPNLAQSFRNAGYQAYAVGKMHVSPVRCRVGFDDIILNEEGRPIDTACGERGDDWEQYLTDQGYSGQSFASGMASNDYCVRPWSLPEDCHPTNWSVREMCRTIARRDPTRPAFWYLSFITPHPPLQPLAEYLDMYREVPIDEPVIGEWARDPERLPYMLRWQNLWYSITNATRPERDLALRAFYAMQTHIDHQIRLVVGTLREEGILHNTALVFTADHGDMLGTHGLWAKQYFYEMSAKVPLIIVPPSGDKRLAMGARDERLVELSDLMPTLLDLAGVQVPESLDGHSLLSNHSRAHLFGEVQTGPRATRMMRDSRFKLIYYAAGNHFQLFDLVADPNETRDLSSDPNHAGELERLQSLLMENLSNADRVWVQNGKWTGTSAPALVRDTRDLGNQRGLRFS